MFAIRSPSNFGRDHICVATLITGAGQRTFSADGKSVTQYKLPDPMVTNVCVRRARNLSTGLRHGFR